MHPNFPPNPNQMFVPNSANPILSNGNLQPFPPQPAPSFQANMSCSDNNDWSSQHSSQLSYSGNSGTFPSNATLPLPYQGQKLYSHQVATLSQSSSSFTEQSSSNNSFKNSPVHTPQIDAMETQMLHNAPFQRFVNNPSNNPQFHSNLSSSGPVSNNQCPPVPVPPHNLNLSWSPPVSSHNGTSNRYPFQPHGPPTVSSLGPYNRSASFNAPPSNSETLPPSSQQNATFSQNSSHLHSNQSVPNFKANNETNVPKPLLPPNPPLPQNLHPTGLPSSQFLSPDSQKLPTSSASTLPNSAAPYTEQRNTMTTSFPGNQTSLQRPYSSHPANSPPQNTRIPHPPMVSGMRDHTGIQSPFAQMQIGAQQTVNLMQEKALFLPEGNHPPRPEFRNKKQVNCDPDIMRCTLNAMPVSSAILNKCRLPLGLIMHPFRDLTSLPVIQASVIVRCRTCRTYINPFISFPDNRRWKCSVCFKLNDLPDEFQYDPVSKVYGEPHRRPEIKSATVEFIAPAEYMVRPPQPAVYVFLMDVSRNGLETRYISTVSQTIMDFLNRLPGDSRTQVAFITYDSGLQFYKLSGHVPRMMICKDLDDIFLPDYEGLLVNLSEHKDTIREFLSNLDEYFTETTDCGNCLGSALQVAYKLVHSCGGRITVFNTSIPNIGAGALKSREESSVALAEKNLTANLGPAIDFYKTFALECSGQQITVDLFHLGNSCVDLATLSCVCRHTSGTLFYYPHYILNTRRSDKQQQKEQELITAADRERFRVDLQRYLTRKIGFEAVMRVRCTRGIRIQAFYGNCFMRSTDLCSLPNVNPDAGFCIHMNYDDTLTDLQTVCFQSALLYTSSRGERRIRVHTLCIPLVNQVEEVFRGADHEAITCLLAKMAVDRTITSGLSNSREALINAVVDPVSAFGSFCISSPLRATGLHLPFHLRLLPVYILSLLRHCAFTPANAAISLDQRTAALDQLRNLPVNHLISFIYPRLYAVHLLMDYMTKTSCNSNSKPTLLQSASELAAKQSRAAGDEPNSEETDEEEGDITEDEENSQLAQLHLSAKQMNKDGAYLLDAGRFIYLILCANIRSDFVKLVFNTERLSEVAEGPCKLPIVNNTVSRRLRAMVKQIQFERPLGANLVVFHNEHLIRRVLIPYLIEDRTEASMSYSEFLQYIQRHAKYCNS